MKNLGKIFLLLAINLFAGVQSYVDNANIVLGDSVTFTIKLSGNDVEKPDIDKLCGVDATGISQSTSFSDINGHISKTYILGYRFEPQKSCVIKPITVKIDGKDLQTQLINIKVTKTPQQTKDTKFNLELSTNKKEVLVGEPFDVTFKFKQKMNSGAVELRYSEPKFEGFWVKSKTKPKIKQGADYSLTTITYTLTPQRVGKLQIDPAKIAVAQRVLNRGDFGVLVQQVKWRSYYSNTLSVDVKPLPNGVDLVGDFQIFTKYKQTNIAQNEAFNVEVVVKGQGNLEDIKSFKPNIKGVNVFDEKLEIKGNELTQKLAFVSDEDFTVPPFKLVFFDTKSKKTKVIKTKAIKVHVDATHKQMVIKQPTKTDVVTTTVVKKEPSYTLSVVTFFIGLVVGMLFMWSKPWQIEREQKVNIKDKKLLLIKLLPFKDEDDVKKVVDILEKNIYENQNIELDKKLLKEVVKKYLV